MNSGLGISVLNSRVSVISYVSSMVIGVTVQLYESGTAVNVTDSICASLWGITGTTFCTDS